MKQQIKHITLLVGLLGSILFTACEKVIDVDLPEHDPVLVLNGTITNDSAWYMTVSKSQHILVEDELDMIDGATVEVYEGSTLLTSFTDAGGGEYFSTTNLPEINKDYTIKVSAPGYNNVEATTRIPSPIAITEVDKRDSTSTLDGILGEVLVSFDDPANERNFYQISVMTVDTAYSAFDTLIFLNPVSLTTLDPAADPEFYPDGVLLSDAVFDGQSRTIAVELDQFYFDTGRTLIVILSAISEDFYYYKKSFRAQQINGDNPFAQPAQVYTNVQNGLGIFAGYSLDYVIVP